MITQIVLIPVGSVEKETLMYLSTTMDELFECTCEIGTALPIPKQAYNPARHQYSGQPILAYLPSSRSGLILGVADLDLYAPGLNFIFGLADYKAQRAVIALPRLHQSFYGGRDKRMQFLARAAKEAVHEVGHLFGLNHCQDQHCVMSFSNCLADTDYKDQTFCHSCRSKLQKVF
jgi:archaemetzincin